MTPEQRALRARLGGLATASRHDVREVTAPARRAFLQRFEDEVDPDRTLPPAERARRAQAARRLHFSRLAMKSAAARKRRAS